jgi:hypothetical protein
LLCYVQPCVIFIAAKWRCKRIFVQIGNYFRNADNGFLSA